MVDERLPSASVVAAAAAAVRGGAAGPLGRRLVGGGGVRGRRGRREELVGEDGGGPLATDYRRHGAAALPRRVAPPQPISAAAVALLPAAAGHPADSRLSPPPRDPQQLGLDRRSRSRPGPPPGLDPLVAAAAPVLMGPDWSGPGPDGLMGWVVGFLTPSSCSQSQRGVGVFISRFAFFAALVNVGDFYVFPLAFLLAACDVRVLFSAVERECVHTAAFAVRCLAERWGPDWTFFPYYRRAPLACFFVKINLWPVKMV
jgi:hypothetical protein